MNSVTVLIAAPGSGAISADVVSRLGHAPRWLAEGEAAEFPGLEVGAATGVVAGLPIDVNAVPLAKRRKKLLLADMDSTMVHQECIDELGVAAGVGDKIKTITARAMRGEIDFEGALKERVSLLAGLEQSVIGLLLRERITFMEGGLQLLATMKAHEAYCVLVSGGFSAFALPIAHALGFDECHANRLVIQDGMLTGEVALPILGKDAKLAALQRCCAARGLEPAEAIAVGDGANDIPMLAAAGMGVALHAKPAVQAQARFVINHGDLTGVLYLQGYQKSEFASIKYRKGPL